jgi:hypothetical protein
MALPPHLKGTIVKYLKKLAELAAAGFVAGAGSYVAVEGVDLSSAGLRGLLTAGLLAAYGVLVKNVGEDKDSPLAK